MKHPVARPVPNTASAEPASRNPRAFDPRTIADLPAATEPLTDEISPPELLPETVSKKRTGWLTRILLGAGGVVLSLAFGLWAEALIRDLFTRYEWLGWFGLAALALLVLAAIGLSLREILALMRLRSLDALRERAKRALETDSMAEGKAVADEMQALYQDRADLARPRQMLADNMSSVFDGAEMIRLTERSLMTSLDNRARALTAGSARRVAVVTAISPRAIVDIAFVAYESFRLARAVAELYGARPGFFGTTRLARAVLGHLAVTGGVALGDSVIQQLVGHGLAARLSARLGEGLVNGMMMVRVGIAAMRVVRPLPFEALKQPVVSDFLADLSKATATGQSGEPVPKGKA